MPQPVRTAGLPGDAARTLLDLVSCQGNGTWQLHPDDENSPGLLLQIEEGRLVDLQRSDLPNVLVRALVTEGSLRSRDRNRLEKQAAELGVCPGVLCLEEGLFDPSLAAELIGQVVDGDLVPVLSAGPATWSGPQQQDIGTGLQGRVNLGQSIEEVLLRSARRHQLWETVTDLPLLREVVAATPAAMALVSDPQQTDETQALLEAADGIQDLGEIAGSRPDPWHALDHLLELLSNQHLETQNSMELFRAGETLLASDQPHRALRRWRSAEEKGLDDFDLGARIGRTCAVTGRTAEADRRLRAHAQRCSDQLRIDAARDAWSGVAALDPTDREARQKAIALWQRDPGDDPTHCLELARALIDGQQADAACQLLDSVGAQIPDPLLHELHEEAACSAGDPDGSLKARWRRAESLRASDQFDQAKQHYEYLATQEQPGPLLSLRLTEIAMDQGDQSLARQYCSQALIGPSGEPRILDGESRQALESLSERSEAPSDLHRWIADNAQRSGDTQLEAVSRQRQSQAHQLEDDLAAACEAARRSHQLQPENLDLALEHARLEEQRGDPRSAISTLEQTLQQLPEGHPREQELIGALEQRDRSSRIALQRSLAQTEQESPRHRSILLRLQLLSLLHGEQNAPTGKRDSGQQVVEILSALIETEQDAATKLQSVAQQLRQQPDPLVQLVREALSQVNPEHPLLQSPVAAPPVTDSTRGAVVRTGIGGISEKLKNVQTHDCHKMTPTSEPDTQVASTNGSESEAGKGIQSALDRLRSMRGAGADADSGVPESATEKTEKTAENRSESPDVPATPPSVDSEEVIDAAARLGALREGASGS